MPTIQERARALLRGTCFGLVIDAVVLTNFVMVGVQADASDTSSFLVPRACIVGAYCLEVPLRLFSDGSKLRPRLFVNILDLVVLILALVDTVQNEYTWFWRSTLLRSLRFLRVYRLAENSPALAELWLVLAGAKRAVSAMSWLALLLVVVLFACSATAKGLVDPDSVGEDGPGDSLLCGDGAVGPCFDAQEYFGTVPRAMLTMLQILTLDSWVSHIVRPLITARPFAAAALLVFAFVAAYTVLSISVGVLVWSTVQLARSHGDHDSIKAKMEEEEIIKQLGEFFRTQLIFENRTQLDLKELQDAMLIPTVSSAIHELELPVSSVGELFNHLDRTRVGAITVAAFEEGLRLMKKPATRFDIACLSATIGGSVTFTGRLEARASAVNVGLGIIKEELVSAFQEVSALTHKGGGMSQAPELLLRRAGRVARAPAAAPERYS